MEGCNKYCTTGCGYRIPAVKKSAVLRRYPVRNAQLAAQGVRVRSTCQERLTPGAGETTTARHRHLADLLRLVKRHRHGIDRIRFTTSHPIEFSPTILSRCTAIRRSWSVLHLPGTERYRVLNLMGRTHTARNIKQSSSCARRGGHSR